MKWIWLSMPPAVTMRPSPAITSVEAPITMPGVTPGHDVGVARLAHSHDAAAAHADVGLHDAPVVEDEGVGDHEIQHAVRRHRARRLPHAVADHLAAAELHLVAVDGEVALDLDEELGVGEAHPVAHGGAEEVGVLPARDAEAHPAAPAPLP